jgi:UDP-sulfoquinovose synthase
VRVLILGGDGYIGWPLCQMLASRGHVVHMIDNGVRRRRVSATGANSLVPIKTLTERITIAREEGIDLTYDTDDVSVPGVLDLAIRNFEPDVVVHLAQQPSVPLSMLSAQHAVDTQIDNISSTLRLLFAIRDRASECHLVKLGTMGQYGTPDVLPLHEGYLSVAVDGVAAEIPMPRFPGSFYHASKVHDSTNIAMACRLWDLRATELNQGVVYGHHSGFLSDAAAGATRLDYDSINGTVINRFCVQASIGQALSVYGTGGQTRGMIALKDSLECIRLVVENPPSAGRLRIFNQMTEYRSVRDLARMVRDAAESLDIKVTIDNLRNPRVEAEEHPYRPTYQGLVDLGLDPTPLTRQDIQELINLAVRNADRIARTAIQPIYSWRHDEKRV